MIYDALKTNVRIGIKKHLHCRCLSVSKNSTRFWTGMPLARKSKIFGLRSIPANTTPVSLKNRYILRFFAYKVFFRRACQRKNRKCSITDERVDFEVYRQTEVPALQVLLTNDIILRLFDLWPVIL